MKRITIASIIIILIFNLIVNTKVNAAYPSIIDDSIEKETLDELQGKLDPNLGNTLSEEGTTNIHKGSLGDDGNYPITDEKTSTKPSRSLGGSAAAVVAGIINLFPTTISTLMTYMVISVEPDTSKKEFTIQDLVFNEYKLFDINFFKMDDYSQNVNDKIKRQIAKWYVAMRNLSIVVSLCVLIYVGIRMAIASIADDKARYKQMLIDWIIGFILIFLMQYIVGIAMFTSDAFTQLIPNPSENLETAIIKGNGTKAGIQEQMGDSKGWNFVTCCILYWLIVYYQTKFIILYMKRLFSVTTLTVIAPLICVVYPIDKIKDKKAQSYKKWFKELMVNIYIQPIHALLYIVFITSAAEIAKVAPLFAILFFAALSRGEKIVKNIFDIRGLKSIHSLGVKEGGK